MISAPTTAGGPRPTKRWRSAYYCSEDTPGSQGGVLASPSTAAWTFSSNHFELIPAASGPTDGVMPLMENSELAEMKATPAQDRRLKSMQPEQSVQPMAELAGQLTDGARLLSCQP